MAGCVEPCPRKETHACELCLGVHKTVDCRSANAATIAAVQASLDHAAASNAARTANPRAKDKGKAKQ